MLRKGTGTAYAKHLGLSADMAYADFKTRVPLISYSDLEPWVNRVKNGEQHILWPGVVRRFAVSAGTTGTGKHIPISDGRLQSDLQFMRRVTHHILQGNPDPGLFLGKHLALSGSVVSAGGFEFGEISGMLACASPKWVRLWHALCPEKAAYMSWPDRFEAIITNAIHSDIRMITGVPSWILILLREVSRRRGMPISHVWPHLRLIITGGVALSGYFNAIKSEIGDLNVRFLENYGASEGYFAFDWFDSGSMLLQFDSSVFFEFIPLPSTHELTMPQPLDNLATVPLWDVQPGMRYGLVVSNMGLWRYVTNDEVVFESVSPPRIRVNGRLNQMTDTFGEAVSASDVRDVIQQVMPDKTYDHVHIRPTWSGSPPLPLHEWIVVVTEARVRKSMRDASSILAVQIDQQLQAKNRHYATRRETGAMGLPILCIIGMDAYETFLKAMPKSQSKLGLFIK